MRGSAASIPALLRDSYDEVAVGTAIQLATSRAVVERIQLFLQTKFAHAQFHVGPPPFDPSRTIVSQLNASLAHSLDNLRTGYVDAYLLHCPLHKVGLTRTDREAWNAMGEIGRSERVKLVGVSNVSIHQLELLCDQGPVPALVQNPCSALGRWDYDVRRYCNDRGIIYQGFGLLRRCDGVRSSVAEIGGKNNRSWAQVVLRFALQIGIVPIVATSDVHHMETNLDCGSFMLTDEEISAVESAASFLGTAKP